MTRDSLGDVFKDWANDPREFLVYDDGLRTKRFSYRDVASRAHHTGAAIAALGVGAGDHVVVWGENRPGWIVVFWACVLRGIVVVPVDYRSSPDFAGRVARIVSAKLVVCGDDVDTDAVQGFTLWRLADVEDVARTDTALPETLPTLTRGDVAEVIFTSGATAEPKGVVITHGNILSNTVPIEREMQKYKAYAAPFAPLRFVNLLPLSHMFGQSMATFVPPMLRGVVVFMRSYHPQDIVREIRTRRASVLVCVPKMLDVLREHVQLRHPGTATVPTTREHWLRRWWRHRAVHRDLGLKFWAFVVGAAPLDPDVEEFWRRLGFVVVQGYGLTETAPIVTLNHPFRTTRGSVGTPIGGVEVKLAEDGEVLVRGGNVTQGYFNAPRETADALHDGWLSTGDIGAIDEQGRLYIKGRKKEMIVTPEGLNVFPEDVERALDAVPGVLECAVVGRQSGAEERVHAVVVLDEGTTVEDVLPAANSQLLDHQRIRSASVWPGSALPRTDGTRKLKRREIKRWVDAGGGEAPVASRGPELTLDAVLGRFRHGQAVPPDATPLAELGLTSLERVELLMVLEDRFHTTIDEHTFSQAQTIGDLRRLVATEDGLPPARVDTRESHHEGGLTFPSWNRHWLVAAVRRASLASWILPLGRVFVRLSVLGIEHLEGLQGPVIFAANHQSHLDTPAVLMALPSRWRRTVAVAMAKEFFKPHFSPHGFTARQVATNRANYLLASFFFNAFPLPQRETGTRETLRYIGELLEHGQSVLIFPEGKRTDRGEINPFRPGVGMIGSRLRVPVIPVRLVGLDHILHHSWKMATPGRASVTFGPPLHLAGDDYAALAFQVQAAVSALDGTRGAAVPDSAGPSANPR
jgi:long-chain acyl-CoA synthetase